MSTDHQNGNGTATAKQTEQALRASELSYRRLFEAAQDGILILDVDTGRIDDVNPFLAKLLGFTHDEMIGKTVGELSPFKDIESNQAMLERLQKQGYVRYEDLPLKTRDGRHIAVEFVSNVYEAGDKKVIQCNVRDITERNKAEEVLRKSEERFRSYFELGQVGVAITSPSKALIEVNDKLCQILGYERRELLQMTWAEMTHPDDLADDVNNFNRVLAGECDGYSMTKRFMCKDGRIIDTDISVKCLRCPDRSVDYFVCMLQDITENRRMEKALRESEVKFRKVFDEANDAIFLIHNSLFVDCNAKGLELLDVSRDQLIGQSPSIFSPATQPDGRNSREKALDLGQRALSGQPQFYEWVHQRPNGTQVYTDVTLNRLELDEKVYLQGIARDITERKRVEEALRSSEANMAAAQRLAHVGSWEMGLSNSTDLDANSVHWSDEIFRICGYEPGAVEPSMMLVTQLVPECEHGAMRNAIAAAIAKRQPYSIIHRVIRPNGEERIVQELGQVFFDEKTSQPLKLVGTTQDITESKEAEKQLLWKTAFFEAKVHSSLDGILIVDGEGRKILQNQRTVDLWKIPREFADAVNDPRQLEWVAGQVKNPKEFAEKVAHLHAFPDEISRDEIELLDERILDRYSSPVRGKDGKYYGRIWTFRDITDRKRAEQQIAEQASFLDKAQDAIFVRDLEGKLLFWNKGAERMYGWVRQEVVGRNMDEFLYTHPEKLKEAYRLTISVGEWRGELQHFTKDQRELTIESRWTLIRDSEGRPKSVLAINTDITEKKKIEAQFMRAQRMESIGTLAGGIAHDLNNILAPILMSIDILKLTATDPQAKSILETIEVSAKRGADVVRQVLSFARGLEGERVEIQPKHLFKDVESIIKDTFPKDIRLHFSIPEDIWLILGDPTQVHQILLNLCVNARDAMPNGGSLDLSVENSVLDEHYVAMHAGAKAGRYVQVSVADSGTGMPPNLIDKIFEPFFTTKDINKGTGLGLSTVMAIVKSHDGIINVYSEPGKGTTFKVYLPAMETSFEARKEQAIQASLPRGNGETILLVDDEASILTITSQTLQAFGYRVLTAGDGAEALGVYAQHRHEIAVVLTDMMMPVLDGAATIHALTKMNPSIKIIAASGLNANGSASRISGTVVKHFLTKPYTAGTLLKTLRKILDET